MRDVGRFLYDVDDEAFFEDSNPHTSSDGEARALEPAALYPQILVGAD